MQPSKSSKYQNHLSFKHKLIRLLWAITWTLLARWIPRQVGNGWKRFLLRLFGAKIASTAGIHNSARIYYPPNLIMGKNACIASKVNCYNVAPVIIHDNVTVSQYTYLCTASHDISSKDHTLITAPIIIEDEAWVAADAYIGMGVTIGKGAVVGARAAVFKDVAPWTVVGGNPAKFIKLRKILS